MRESYLCGALGLILIVCTAPVAHAQQQCGYAGQEFCTNGQTYRCEKTGSELTPIFQNRACVVNVPSMLGTWRGQGHQTPAGTTGSDWSIVMTIQNGGGSIEYPSLSCGGTLTQISNNGTSAQFREHITHGSSCIDGGLLTVNLFNGRLAWSWTGSSRGVAYNAIATLTR
jgi:hypothetical protein